ncbi:MAG: hypothetical protein CML69_10790 [Rhodobacteraceae bacterium]|nr:hypothetical protein [Paracoccaceae bacterium]MBA85209.1 hypothetical protein [Paracoccaceae bacterium]
MADGHPPSGPLPLPDQLLINALLFCVVPIRDEKHDERMGMIRREIREVLPYCSKDHHFMGPVVDCAEALILHPPEEPIGVRLDWDMRAALSKLVFWRFALAQERFVGWQTEKNLHNNKGDAGNASVRT